MIWLRPETAGLWASSLQGPGREPAGRPAGRLDRLAAAGRERGAPAGRRKGVTDEAGGDGSLGPDDDLEAFGRAFAVHEADVVRVCRRLLGSAEDARDAPQEVFLRASRALRTYDRERPLRPWLLAIAGNHCIDRLRQRAAEQRVFADLDPDEASDAAAPGRSPSPLGRLVALEQREIVGRAVAELPLKYRLPLALRYFGDLDYAAIGETLGVSPNQVATLLFRAKRLLREALERAGETRGRR